MKKLLAVLLAALLLAFSVSCTDSSDESSQAESVGESSDSLLENAKKVLRSLEYKNIGKMGDTDGPAFAVYSNVGFSAAEVTLDIAGMDINTLMPDGRYVNGYSFLGIDVYNSGDYWMNCVDAGLCWSGAKGGWHLFYNLYEPLNESTPTWYESRRILPKDDVYTMKLELIGNDKALLTIKGENSGKTDSIELEVKGALADGSNTAFLFNTALDYPPDTKLDQNGDPTEDWVEITLANSDKGIKLRDFRASGLKLFKGETATDWSDADTAAVSIWPDKTIKGFDYSPTEIGVINSDEFYINLDMNR